MREHSPANFFVFGKSAGTFSSVPQATERTLSRVEQLYRSDAKLNSQCCEKGIDKAGWR
jgi:hypothetical protein